MYMYTNSYPSTVKPFVCRRTPDPNAITNGILKLPFRSAETPCDPIQTPSNTKIKDFEFPESGNYKRNNLSMLNFQLYYDD